MASILGLDPTQVDTTAQFRLGQRGEDDDGCEYVYIEADAAIAAYACAIIHADGGAQEVTTTLAAVDAGTGKALCCPQVAIASGSFGWGVVYAPELAGKKCLCLVSCKDYIGLNTTATAGCLDDTLLIGTKVLGIVSSETEGGSGTAALICRFNYPVVDDITQT